ncbi:hypothetical protein AQJ67_00625 [Streptomyces caeruleatus]|uniref:Uncharacterized protein n=1 Tax=Streptomyces caeruleatus TaxID=661399 RepID=A0A117RSC0_9ACTN|nr:hypothetical protein AQJ67_00625 [Streptomyces caeruleatus]
MLALSTALLAAACRNEESPTSNKVQDSRCVNIKSRDVKCGDSEKPSAEDKMARNEDVFSVDMKYSYRAEDKEEFSWALDRKLTADEVTTLQELGKGLQVRDVSARTDRQLREFLHNIGARPALARATDFAMQLTGTTGDKVTVTDFEAEVSNCRASKAVTFITLATAGGIGVEAIGFNLDEDPAKAWIYSKDPSVPPKLYSSERNESLSFTDTASSLNVKASMTQKGRLCEWTITAEFVTAGKNGKQEIDNKGKPFVIEDFSNVTDVWYYDLDYRLKPDGGVFARKSGDEWGD